MECGIALTRFEPVTIRPEFDGDAPARELLLDRAMGPARRRKASERLRRGRLPADGLAFVATNASGEVVGTVRLWHVTASECGSAMLLLGPLAVDRAQAGHGIGAHLMRTAIAEAGLRGHRAIILVGDAPYYSRFGFSEEKMARLAMPGPFERNRFLGLELVEGALDGASGVLMASGKRAARQRTLHRMVA